MEQIRLGFQDEPYLLVTFTAGVLAWTLLCLARWGAKNSPQQPYDRLVEWLFWVTAIGFMAVTLSPSNSIGSTRYCSWTTAIPGSALWSNSTVRLLNTVICVPTGFVAACSRRQRWSRSIVALSLPFGVEAVQWVAPFIGRSCSAIDAVDNLTGSVLGLSIGAATMLAVTAQRKVS